MRRGANHIAHVTLARPDYGGSNPPVYPLDATDGYGTTLNCLLCDLLYRHAMTEGAPHLDPALQLLGATLRQYRQQRGLTQRALTARTGIPSTYISEIEKGRRNIAVLALLRLAYALEIPAACLLARRDVHPSLAPPATCDALTSKQTRDAAVTHDVALFPQPSDPAMPLQLLGATIRQYRQQRGLLQATLATITGLSPTYISEIEQGQRNLSVLSLVRIADALELSVVPLLAPLETRQHPSPPPSE